MRQELWYDPVEEARERYEYQIKVLTQDKPNAGTLASVFCILYGEQGDSKRQRLDETEGHRTHRLFQRASTDTFLVPVAADLGNLTKLVIGTTSWGGQSSWMLEVVEVKRLHRGASPDEARIAPVSKFYHRSDTPIGLKRGYCQVELYPEADGRRGERHNVPQSSLTPSEGSYELSVDIYVSSPEVKGEVLLTAIFIPESHPSARVRGHDWQEAKENYPGASSQDNANTPRDPSSISESAVPLKLLDPEAQEPGQSQFAAPSNDEQDKAPKKAEDKSASANKVYVLPDNFYASLDDSRSEGTVTYKLPTNSTLRLTRSGGTYRIMTRSVKFASGTYDMSDVTKSGDIVVKNRREQARYRVSVFTGNFPEAGTTANVQVILQGDDGSRTSVLDLNTSARLTPQNAAGPPSSKTARAQAMLETGQRKFNHMVNPFAQNSEAVFEVVAEDVGVVAEVIIWHDNSARSLASLNPLYTPAWYLHRVEVLHEGRIAPEGKENATFEVVGEDDQKSRVFVCRKWLTSRDAKLGTRARLVYNDLQQYESIINTYDFAIVLPKQRLVDMKQKGLPFDSLVLFSERVPLGAKITLPKGRVERVISNESVMFCFKQQLGLHLGTLWRAMFVKNGDAFEPSFKGLRVLVTCYERAAYNTVHLTPSLVNESLANTTLANVTASCSAVPWAKDFPLKSVLRVSDRQQAAEPAAYLYSSEPNEEEVEEDEIVPYASGLQKVRADRHADSRSLLASLEIWKNIFESDDFDEEESLHEMIPACARMTLVQIAKRGSLITEHLLEHGRVFNFDQFPLKLAREVEAHKDLAIMNSVALNFDKWRLMQSNSYELEEISAAQCFAWNMLYWVCCTNPPDQRAVAFIIQRAGFEKDDDESDQCLYNVDGLQADFALLLHYIVLRQMAKEDVLAQQEAHVEALMRKVVVEEVRLSWKRRFSRFANKCLRAVVFPFLFVLVALHVVLNIIFMTVIQCLGSYWSDRMMFSKFTDASVLQPTRKENRRMADQWRKTCTGNYKWLSRRWPITQEERRRREKKLLLVGPWRDFWFESRRHFMMMMVPYLSKIGWDMTKWFMVGTTEHSTLSAKSTAVRQKQSCLPAVLLSPQVCLRRVVCV